MQKSTSWALCLLLTLVLGLGCSKAPEPNKLLMWHWMTDRDESLKKLALQYKNETGIEVVIELFAPSDSYSQKIIAAAQANVLPDMYGILDKKSILADFIKAGLVADLTDSFAADEGAWEKSLSAKAIAVNRFEEENAYGVKPGIYGVPIDVTNMQMLYNKKLLAKAGIANPPKTYDEFIKAAVALKRVGIPPFVSGWGEIWLVDCFASNYAFNIMGEKKVIATFRGQVPYTDPDWIKVFTLFADLREKGVLLEGIVTKGNKYAEQDFALERAAFTFNGSWAINVYRDMNPSLDYGVMFPPSMNTPYPLMIWGGAGSSFVVNNTSPKKNKVIDFLKWLTARQQQATLSLETNNLPANREAIALIPPLLGAFAKGMDNSTHPTIWPVNEDVLVTEAFDRGVQAIIIGEKTPKQVAQDVQKIKERQILKGRSR